MPPAAMDEAAAASYLVEGGSKAAAEAAAAAAAAEAEAVRFRTVAPVGIWLAASHSVETIRARSTTEARPAPTRASG